MHPQGFNENSRLRASDADRDGAASVINNALAEGRLTAEEHADRLDAIYSAKTHADLVPLLEDLPTTGSTRPAPVPAGGQLPDTRRGGRIIAILGGATRKGPWHPEPVITMVTVLGGAELDFREAVLPGNEVVLHATCILGGVEVTVPPEMRVIDNGIAILGGREIAGDSAESAAADAPVLRIEGTCLLGGIEVRRRDRKRRKDRLGKGIGITVGGDRGIEGPVREVLDRRREFHDDLRAYRREMHDMRRQRRRDMHRPWTDDED